MKKVKKITIIDDDDDYYSKCNFKHSNLTDDFGTYDPNQEQDELLDEQDEEFHPVIVNAHEYSTEIEVKEQKQQLSKSVSPPRRSVRSEDDGIVYRDKSGKRITKEQWLLLQKSSLNQNVTTKSYPAQELTWGKGLVQIQNRRERLIEEQKIALQPLNRFDIDPDYDKQLLSRQRWADPIAKSNLGESEEENGPICQFNRVPNRFSIAPGYRWDGVIRGNGYEQRWFKARADYNAKQQEYYRTNIVDL